MFSFKKETNTHESLKQRANKVLDLFTSTSRELKEIINAEQDNILREEEAIIAAKARINESKDDVDRYSKVVSKIEEIYGG